MGGGECIKRVRGEVGGGGKRADKYVEVSGMREMGGEESKEEGSRRVGGGQIRWRRE